MISDIMDLTAILFAFSQLRLVCAYYDDPFPRCSSCLSAAQHDAPGLGFGLTPATGTVSAHLFNNTVLDIAEIAAGDEYRSLMFRLTEAGYLKPLTFCEKLCRSINKSLGRAATVEVGILAQHFGQLRDAALSRLPEEDVNFVTVSRALARGLRPEDLEDALTHVGLKLWIQGDNVQAGLYPTLLTEPHAVYAAHGRGLCHNYKDLFECWEEEEQFLEQTLLVAGLTPTDLRVEVTSLKSPFEWHQGAVDYIVEPLAGLESLHAFVSPEAFWEYVQIVLEAFISRSRESTPTSIMLLSADSTRPEFLQALRNALSHLSNDGIERNLTETEYHGALPSLSTLVAFPPQFGPSRGAAQYARWRREAPMGCVEEKRCDDERDKQRSGLKLEPVTEANFAKGELK